MIFKISKNRAESAGWSIRGWSIAYRPTGEQWTPSTLYKDPKPEWYSGETKVICPSMMEGWSKKLLTARQV